MEIHQHKTQSDTNIYSVRLDLFTIYTAASHQGAINELVRMCEAHPVYVIKIPTTLPQGRLDTYQFTTVETLFCFKGETSIFPFRFWVKMYLGLVFVTFTQVLFVYGHTAKLLLLSLHVSLIHGFLL